MFYQLKNKKGHTLIELVLVISLLGIIAYVAIPKDSDSLTALSLDAASRKVKSDLRYTQNLATTSNESYGFRTTSETTYEIYNVTTNEIVLSPHTNQNMNEDLALSYSGITFEDDYTVEFDNMGRPSVGGGSTITLQDSANTLGIQVSSESGYVQILQ